MDPDEVLRLFRQALAEGRWYDAALFADVIDGWMTAGGMLPDQWASVRRVTAARALTLAQARIDRDGIGAHRRAALAEIQRRQRSDGGS